MNYSNVSTPIQASSSGMGEDSGVSANPLEKNCRKRHFKEMQGVSHWIEQFLLAHLHALLIINQDGQLCACAYSQVQSRVQMEWILL